MSITEPGSPKNRHSSRLNVLAVVFVLVFMAGFICGLLTPATPAAVHGANDQSSYAITRPTSPVDPQRVNRPPQPQTPVEPKEGRTENDHAVVPQENGNGGLTLNLGPTDTPADPEEEIATNAKTEPVVEEPVPPAAEHTEPVKEKVEITWLPERDVERDLFNYDPPPEQPEASKNEHIAKGEELLDKAEDLIRGWLENRRATENLRQARTLLLQSRSEFEKVRNHPEHQKYVEEKLLQVNQRLHLVMKSMPM